MVFNPVAVIGVTQLVCQRDNVAERTVKVGQHAALLQHRQVAAESTADLALAREEVDPLLVEGTLDDPGDILGEWREVLDQIRFRFIGSEGAGAFAHQGEQFVKRQAVGVAEQLCFMPQISVEARQRFVNRREHCVQRFLPHAGIEQRHVQDGIEVTQLADGVRFAFDRIQREADGVLDFIISF